MSDIEQARNDPKGQLWGQLDDSRAVMLGIVGSGQHLQPMSPQVSKDEELIWFYTRNDTDLMGAVRRGGEALLTLVSDDEDYHACLSGELVERLDPETVNKYWSPIVAAWFHDGQDDPALTMIAFRPTSASIWASTDSSMRFGWQIAKANITDEEPDVGYHTVLKF